MVQQNSTGRLWQALVSKIAFHNICSLMLKCVSLTREHRETKRSSSDRNALTHSFTWVETFLPALGVTEACCPRCRDFTSSCWSTAKEKLGTLDTIWSTSRWAAAEKHLPVKLGMTRLGSADCTFAAFLSWHFFVDRTEGWHRMLKEY